MSDKIQIIDFNDSNMNRQLENLYDSVNESIEQYKSDINERIEIMHMIYNSVDTFFCETLKELEVTPMDMYAYIREALSMEDCQFESMVDSDNAFGLPILTFIDKNRSTYTIYATLAEADNTDNVAVSFAITRIGRNKKESYLNGDHVWCEMNTISEHSAVVNMYGKTTELQKKILSHDTPESTFLKSVLDKYGEITDENYKEIKKKYMNILESSLPTDGYFELASDGEIVLRGSLKMGFCITEKNGKWNIYQYVTHDDMELMGFQAGSMRDYKKLIGTTENESQALRLFNEQNPILELIIPVSVKNAVVVPESLLMSDLKGVLKEKYTQKLNQAEKKKLDEFCDWFDQFPPFDAE